MINEVKQLKMLEKKRGLKMPLPNFFYVERYGRCAEEQMDELIGEIGRKEWFLFKTDVRNKEGGLLHSFIIELEKHAKVGKEYDECVLIEFSEEILLEEGFEEFIEYIKTMEDRIYFIFSMKQSKNTASVQKCTEQYFFIRKILAKEYLIEEQWKIIKDTCEEYGFAITKEAEEYFKEELEKREWKAEEQLKCKLRNAVCSVVYEGMMESENGMCTLDMAKKMLLKTEPEHKKRAIIGFSQGGLQYE